LKKGEMDFYLYERDIERDFQREKKKEGQKSS
jgi:hypothetical protein